MPITTDKNSEVKLFCSNCYGDGENNSVPCETCKGTGKILMPIQDWIKKNFKQEDTNNPGLYTFDDMMKAFQLGIIAECGDLPHEDYVGSVKLIQRYFTQIDNEK